MKTYIVTGATGYLGSRITRTLINNGERVIVLKRKTSSMARLEDVLDKVVAFDLDSSELTTLFQDEDEVDAVIHTATCYGREKEGLDSILEVNTLLPLRLLELANKNNVKCFLNIDTLLGSNVNAYALSKHQFVEWAEFLSVQFDIKFVNLKSEYFYGPGDNESSFISYIIKSCLCNVDSLDLTLGEQKRDFIYIEDLVSLIMLLLSRLAVQGPKFTEYEVGSGNSIAIKDMVELIRRLTSSSTKLNFGAIPYRENEVMLSEVNISQLNALGWSSKYSLEEGLVKTIRSMSNV